MSAEDWRWLYSSGAERFRSKGSYMRTKQIRYDDRPSMEEIYRAMPQNLTQYKRPRTTLSTSMSPGRVGYTSVPRTRGAAVTGEMKYFDSSLDNNLIGVVTNTWQTSTEANPVTQNCLFAPTVGAAVNQRIGKSASVHKIKVRGVITCPLQSAQSNADNSTLIRVILLQDKQTNAAANVVPALVMNDGVGANATINSYQNINEFGRYRVLKDKIITVGNLNMTGDPSAGQIAQAANSYPFKFNIKFNQPVVVRFNATNGGTNADISDNSFHMLAACNSQALSCTCSYYARVCYKG